MAQRSIQRALVAGLSLALAGGTSAFCLMADLCTRSEVPRPAVVATEAVADPEAVVGGASVGSAESCHRSAADPAPTPPDSAARAEGRFGIVHADECCDAGEERIDAKTEKRHRLARWTGAALAMSDPGLRILPLVKLASVLDRGPPPGYPPSAFTMNAALLL